MSTTCPPLTAEKTMTETEESIKLTTLSGARERIPNKSLDAERVSKPKGEATVVTIVTATVSSYAFYAFYAWCL